MINYNGLTKAEILSVLYNNAKAVGLGILLFEEGDMSIDEAEKLLKKNNKFSYIKGRSIHVDLSNDHQFDEYDYNKVNGEKSAEQFINEYIENKKINVI